MRTYRLVDQERAHHAVSLLCSVLAVSRQAYYAWRSRPPSTRVLRDIELKALIIEVFDESRRTYGAPRIAKTLRRKRGQPVATERIARLMGELGLQGVGCTNTVLLQIAPFRLRDRVCAPHAPHRPRQSSAHSCGRARNRQRARCRT